MALRATLTGATAAQRGRGAKRYRLLPHGGPMVHSHVLKGHPMTKYEKQGSGMPSHLCKGPPPTVNEAVWYGSKCRCCGELIG
jgi:hypothetical protein